MAVKKYTNEDLIPLLVKQVRNVGNVEKEILGVPLYAQYENIGGADSLTEPSLFEINLARTFLNANNPKYGLTPNVSINKTATNLVIKAKEEFNEQMKSKDAEIERLKAQLEGKSKRTKVSESDNIDKEIEKTV